MSRRVAGWLDGCSKGFEGLGWKPGVVDLVARLLWCRAKLCSLRAIVRRYEGGRRKHCWWREQSGSRWGVDECGSWPIFGMVCHG